MELKSSNVIKKRKALDVNSERLDVGLPSGKKRRKKDKEPASKSTILTALYQVTEHGMNINNADHLAASQLVSDQESQSVFKNIFISSSDRKTEGLASKRKRKDKMYRRPGKAQQALSPSTRQNQNPTISADSFGSGGACSLEELKTFLDLWRKSIPASLSGQLHESTQSTGGLSSSEGGENDKKTQQSLENPTSTFAQNDQAKVPPGAGETTQSSIPLSHGKKHDLAISNLSKCSESQVAIVTPLMLPKENIQSALLKNNPSLEITSPLSKEGGEHGLQHIICSPSQPIKYCKDIHVHQKAVLSTQENRIVKVEPCKKYCHELIQKAVSHSHLKSQLGSGDNLPPDKTVSQNYIQSQTGPDLAESRETDEVVYNDAVLQISSVCTLVKGDAFYNSQIANIFNTSPLTSSMENDTSSKDSIRLLQCDDQQSGILKTESEPESTEPELSLNVSEGNAVLPSPCELSRAVEEIFKSIPDLEMSQSYNNSDEMNKRNAEEGGNSLLLPEKKLEENVSCGVDSTDVVNGNQELCPNIEDQFSSSTGGGLCVVNKESTVECVSTEENQEHFGSIAEAPVTLLSDQLNELSKEFPYGIGYLKTLNVTGNNDTMPKPNDTGNTENLQILRKCHDPSGAIDQIKITMLNSEQMREVFPERKKQFSNNSENSEVDCFKRDSEANLTRKNISRVTTDKAIAVEPRETASEKSFKREIPTYCCTEAWIATGYVSSPCRCALVKGLGSKQELDLCSQSETRVKCRPKPSDNSNVDFKLNSQLSISTLDTVSKTVSSGTQSVRTLTKISGPKNSNECKPHQIDQVVSLLEMLSLQNPKQNNKHIRNELSHHASSQKPVKSRVDTVRRQRIKIKHNTNCERYKVKQDSSETHMIKVPTLNKSLKRQKAVERKSKALAIQHNDAISASDLSSVGSFSQMCEKSQYISILHSQEPLNGNKFLNVMDLEKRYGYNKVEHKEGTDSEHH